MFHLLALLGTHRILHVSRISVKKTSQLRLYGEILVVCSVNITKHINTFDIPGSVHHSIIHIQITNKIQHCIKIYYSIFNPYPANVEKMVDS